MKILLMSMPDAAPVIMHESAFHMPNLGIASLAANLDATHTVWIADLIRKRRHIGRYIGHLLKKYRPDMVGLSTMTWQYDTCTRIMRHIKQIAPRTKIVLGGYHPTLMYEEIAESPESQWIDFMVRGEGEETLRRLISAVEGKRRFDDIAALSWKNGEGFVHNPHGRLLDLAEIRLPLRDGRRLTWGYHIMNKKMEVMETSRGCTRGCNFCSMQHMYGKTFRTYPMKRILADIDDIYYNRKTRWILLTDDNLVLDVDRVHALCDAIVSRGYKGLNLVAQTDCITMSRNENMVRRMSRAGFKSVFLGIENASKKNLAVAKKGDIVEASQKAVAVCQRHGMMVMGGLIFGFPDDDEQSIVDNYRFLKEIGTDTSYCQILTPYPKTGMRDYLLSENLVTNKNDYKRYNGMWANVRTRNLDAEQLQYLVWLHRQKVLGWWEPSERIQSQGKLWTGIWRYVFRPMLRIHIKRMNRRYGWRERYRMDMDRLEKVNLFPDLPRGAERA